MRYRYLPAALTLVTLVACADSPQEPADAPAPAPLFAAGGQDQAQDRYIVVFKAQVADPDAETDNLIRAHGGEVHFRYRAALKGFAASLSAQALEGIRRNPNVDYVEVDGVATISASPQTLSSAQWGLDRLDQRDLPVDLRYNYENEAGNVEAYILDTGIRYTHQEFGGRAVSGHDYVSGDELSEDCHGHGTHVAGTVGGSTVGVAKSVKLIGVRVLNCSGSGSYSGIIAAVDGVTGQKLARPAVPMVGNMSLGGGVSLSLNSAVNNSVSNGVVWAVAAGNENTDACTRSPASAANALTIGASTSSDARASFSNYGTCVDLFAPGAGIYSSTYNGDNTYASWNGTSMASPHAAGVAALFLSANPGATAAQVEAAIEGGATPNKVTNPGTGSPNLLLYSLIASGGSPPPPPEPPPADIDMHVGDVATLEATAGRKNWNATLIIRAHENTASEPHPNLAGATISVTWYGGSSGSGSCLTGSDGICTIATGSISNSQASVTFHVDGLSKPGYVYVAGQNHDDASDGSSFVNDEITATNPSGGGGNNPNPGKGKKP